MIKRALLIVSLSLIGCAASAQTQPDPQAECIDLNNEGVKAINRKDWPLAFKRFEAALKLDPNYQLARDNIVVTHGQYGMQLSLEHKFAAAIKELHQAAYPDSDFWSQRLAETIVKMGKDPKNFQDRVDPGDQAKADGDTFGEIIEYQAAVQLKDDAAVRQKLGEAMKSIGDEKNAELEFGVAKWIKRHDQSHKSGTTAPAHKTGETGDIDDSPAMQREWHGWHARVSSELYQRYAGLSNAAFGHSLKRLQASATYIVTRDRRILDPTLNIKSSDPIYNTLIIGVIKSLDGSPILEFPPESKLNQVEKSATFSQNCGVGDFYPSVGNFDEKRPDRGDYERMLQYQKLNGHGP